MRYYGLDAGLPAKAALRIRQAPHGDADVCGRISKGHAIAVCAPEFQVPSEDDETLPQKWLHVVFPDDSLEEMVEGYVMASLPDGMTLMAPWDDTDFLSCCRVLNEHALLYDSPLNNAEVVGRIDAGEGVRFPFGVLAVDGSRVQIYHDEYGTVWVNAVEIEVICEMLEHPKCKARHSFFALNEQLPPEAQIAIRSFPSKEAETVTLLSRGEVIEAELRSENWLQLAEPAGCWIMLQSGSWDLLTEIPYHKTDRCEATLSPYDPSNDAPMGDNQVRVDSKDTFDIQQEVDMNQQCSSPITNDRSSTEDEQFEDTVDDMPIADDPAEASSNYAVDTEASNYTHGVTSSWEDRPIKTSSQEDHTGIVSEDHSLSSALEDQHVDDQPIPAHRRTDASVATPSWDEQPLPTQRDPSGDASERVESWEDQPIPTQQVSPDDASEAALSWDDQPLPAQQISPEFVTPATPSWDDQSLSVQRDSPGDVEDAVPSWDDQPLPSQRVSSDVVSDTAPLWDDQPLPAQQSAPHTASSATSRWDEQPLPASWSTSGTVTEAVPSWDDQPLPTQTPSGPSNDSTVSVPSWGDQPIPSKRDSIADVNDAEPSWDDQPLPARRNLSLDASEVTQSWDDQPLPTQRSVADVTPETAVSWDEQPLPAQPDSEKSAPLATSSWEEQPLPTQHRASGGKREVTSSWEDRPLPTRRRSSKDTGRTSSWDDQLRPSDPAGQSYSIPEDKLDSAKNTWDEAPIKSRHAMKSSSLTSSIDTVGNLTPGHWGADATKENTSPKSETAFQPITQSDGSPAYWNVAMTGNGEGTADTDPSYDSSMLEEDSDAQATDEEMCVVEETGEISLSLHARPIDASFDDDVSELQPGEVMENISTIESGMEDSEVETGDEGMYVVEETGEIIFAQQMETSYEEESSICVVEETGELSVIKKTPVAHDVVEEEGENSEGEVVEATVAEFMTQKLHELAPDRVGYGLFRAIASDADADTILENLVMEHSEDASWLKYEPPALRNLELHQPESNLLDVLYSRENGEPPRTPTKNTPSSPGASGVLTTPPSHKDRLNDICSRTPVREGNAGAFNLIMSNATPEKILGMEFGSHRDELGLFGGYQYPVLSSSNYQGSFKQPAASPFMGGRVRGNSGSGFAEASFASPDAKLKTNPLKRSASAIAKTPPVASSKLSHTPQATPPPQQVQRSTPQATPPPQQVQRSSATVPRVATGAPNVPSASRPGSSTSRPTTPSASIPTPASRLSTPSTSRVRASPSNASSLKPPSALPRPSVTTSGSSTLLRRPSATALTPTKARTQNSIQPPTNVAAASPGSSALKAPQSTLQRKSFLPTPSPSKLGVTRANSANLSSQLGDSAAARRMSFGFARPSSATTRK